MITEDDYIFMSMFYSTDYIRTYGNKKLSLVHLPYLAVGLYEQNNLWQVATNIHLW